MRATHWNVILPVLRKKIPNKLEGEFTYEDWLHCFYRRSFKTRFEICKDEDGEFSDIRAFRKHAAGDNDSTETDELSGRFLTRVQFIHPRGSITRSILCCKSWTGSTREKNVKKVVQKEDKHFSSQLLIFFNNDASEAEVVTDFKKPRKVSYQIH